MSGRRRQGKTYLLQALTRATGGFYFVAEESTGADALRQFGRALGAYLGSPLPGSFAHWEEAVQVMRRDRHGKHHARRNREPHGTQVDRHRPPVGRP